MTPIDAYVRHGKKMVSEKRCGVCGEVLPASAFCRRDATYLASACKSCTAQSTRRYRAASPEVRLLSSARARAKREGLEFDLEVEDLHVPAECPVLGIRLSREFVKRKDETPSVDRINPRGGYTKGNVAVISWRANRLKSDASAAELRALAQYASQT